MIYDSFEQALNMSSQPTYYEQEHNIAILSRIILVDEDDIKLVKTITSNQEHGLVIYFRVSTKYNKWAYWFPTKNQQQHLPKIAELLYKLDYNTCEAK